MEWGFDDNFRDKEFEVKQSWTVMNLPLFVMTWTHGYPGTVLHCQSLTMIITNYINCSTFQNDSPLHKIKWLRIILDEGHTIRNPQTRLTKAMIDLAAERRWVHRHTNTKQVGWPVVCVQISSLRAIRWQGLVEICTGVKCEERGRTRRQVSCLTFSIKYLKGAMSSLRYFGHLDVQNYL